MPGSPYVAPRARLVAEVVTCHGGSAVVHIKRRDRNGALLMSPRKGSARLLEQHRELDGHLESCRQYNKIILI